MKNLRVMFAFVATFLCVTTSAFAAVPANWGWNRPLAIVNGDWLTSVCSDLLASGDTTKELLLTWRGKIEKSAIWQDALNTGKFYKGFDAGVPMHLCVANAWLDQYNNFDQIADAATVVHSGQIFRFPITKEAANKVQVVTAWTENPALAVLTSKVNDLSAQISDLQSEIRVAISERDNFMNRASGLDASQQEISDLTLKVKMLQGLIHELELDIVDAQDHNASLSTQLDELQQFVNSRNQELASLRTVVLAEQDHVRLLIKNNSALTQQIASVATALSQEQANHVADVANLKAELAAASARFEIVSFVATPFVLIKERLVEKGWNAKDAMLVAQTLLGCALLSLFLFGWILGMAFWPRKLIVTTTSAPETNNAELEAEIARLADELRVSRVNEATALVAKDQAERAVKDLLNANVGGLDHIVEAAPFDTIDITEIDKIEAGEEYQPMRIKWHTLFNKGKGPELTRYQIPNGLRKAGEFVPRTEFLRILSENDEWCNNYRIVLQTPSKLKQQAA